MASKLTSPVVPAIKSSLRPSRSTRGAGAGAFAGAAAFAAASVLITFSSVTLLFLMQLGGDCARTP